LISSSLCVAARSLSSAWLNTNLNFVWRCRNLCIQLIFKSSFCWLLQSNFIVMNRIWLTRDDQSQKIISSIQSVKVFSCLKKSRWYCWWVIWEVSWSLIRFRSVVFAMSCWRAIFRSESLVSLFWQTVIASWRRSCLVGFECFFMMVWLTLKVMKHLN